MPNYSETVAQMRGDMQKKETGGRSWTVLGVLTILRAGQRHLSDPGYRPGPVLKKKNAHKMLVRGGGGGQGARLYFPIGRSKSRNRKT